MPDSIFSLTNTSRALFFCTLALPAAAQPNFPVAFSAVNTASYSGTVAQGSLFIVFGMNIGPAQLVPATSYPLLNQLGGTSITVMSGTAILACPMVYSAAGVAAAILPSNTPPGRGTVNLTYNGQPTPFPVQINVVPSAPGIYTSTSSGLGPGVFTTLDGIVKTFAVTAKPGETVVAWVTGLGPISGPDNVAPSTFPNFPGVEVFVGTQAATVIYAGRTGCCAGVDQINFQVPAGLSGCYLPVTVRSGGMLSNFVSLAVSSNGGACSDIGPTVPVSVVNQATAEQPVKIAALAVGPVSVLSGLGFNQRRDLAQRLSKLLRVNVAPQDVEGLLRARQNHDQRAARRIMAKYAAAWKALGPTAKAAVNREVSLTQEGALGAFGEYFSPSTLAAAFGGLFPSQGTCTVANLASQPSGRSSTGLDAGPSLTLTGQAGSWTLMPTSAGEYQALFGSTPSGPDIPPGSYTVAGGGGRGVGAFSANLTVGGNILWANKQAISTVDRSQPLTVTWSGGTRPGYVLIGGYSESSTGGHLTFICSEDISKGSFTIPSFILSALPASAGGAMFIGPHPLSQPVSISGVDLAFFVDGSSDSKTVSYR